MTIAPNPELTELTTAATDAMLAALACACLVILWPYRATNRWRWGIWSAVFALLAIASLLGAVAHGLDLSAGVRAGLWRPLYLSLGFVVALFCVGAVFDYGGQRAARIALLPMLALGFGFFLLTQLTTGSFLLFVVYEAVAMLAALVMYLLLSAKRRLDGAGLIAAAIVLNMAAAGIQASGTVSLSIGVPLDHNGVFHLVQLVAIALLTPGLVRGMR